MSAATRLARRLMGAREGVAAIETALIMSLFLVPFMLAVWDVGQIAAGKSQLDEALQDTITYVSAGNATNGSGITTAAQAAYGSGITVATTTSCFCVSTSSSQPTQPTSTSCSAKCGTGYVLQQFMSITTSSKVVIPFPVPFLNLTSPMTITSTGSVRTG
jgi:Flp pilus assembly protein TadG